MSDYNQQSLDDSAVADEPDQSTDPNDNTPQEGEIVDTAPVTASKQPEEPAEKEPEASAEPEKPKSILTDEDKREMTIAARTQETSVLSPVMYNQSKLVAKDFFESGALPRHLQNETQAFVTIITGAEMGLKPMEAIQGLYIINGIITLWGKAVPRQLKKHGYKFKYVTEDQDHCEAVVWKGDSFQTPGDEDEQYEATFRFQDAVDSGYTMDNYGNQKVGWKQGQNRKLKMRYNVLAELIKTYIPEVLGQAADIAEVAQDYIEGEVVKDPVDPKAAIRAAVKNKQSESTGSATVKPQAEGQDQGEDESL